MAYPAAAIANEFLSLAQCDGKDITPLKMQKLVYFAHGWYLALFKLPLLSESVQAWDFGPVVSSLYREFKPFGSHAITEDASVDGMYPHLSDPEFQEDSADARAVIKQVWDQYQPYTASQLVSLTHSADSPWSAVPDKNRRRGACISNDAIQRYFERRLEQA